MDPDALAAACAIVAGQTILLYLLSRRLLMGLVVRTLAARTSGRLGRSLLLLLRLPGNLLHEWSHAAGYVMSGYTIADIASCLSDRQGWGYCTPGRPWSPIHWTPLAAGVAAVLPLFVGALVIRSLAGLLGIDLPAADLLDEAPRSAASHLWSDLGAFVLGLDWRAWQTYLFWYLALSIGAELAPSDTDLRRGGPVLGALLGIVVLFVYAVPHMELRPESARTIAAGLWWILRTLSAVLFAGLGGCGLVGAVAGLLALAVGGGRQR